jgi:protein-L-isoaspartate(D-aspartate) O-methyltransferase
MAEPRNTSRRWLAIVAIAGVALALAAAGPPRREGAMSDEMAAMLRAIEADVRATAGSIGKSRLAPRVMAAMAKVPRHEFVPAALRDAAYDNRPLPIGKGQTISQPYIVALMTDLAELDAGDSVLEVGTGSGYQAAVLAELAAKVRSIEIVADLGRDAGERLRRLGYANVECRIGDGYAGWPEAGPFDAILVTAAAPHVPQPLVDQLKVGGRLVIPVAHGPFGEDLLVLRKRADGGIDERRVLPVRFVPLTGAGSGQKYP